MGKLLITVAVLAGAYVVVNSLPDIARKSVEGDVNIRLVNDNTIEIEGERAFDIRDYGLDPPKLLMLRVHPDVRVRGRIVAEREG